MLTGLADGFTLQWQAPSVNPGSVTGYELYGWGGNRIVSAATRSITVHGVPRTLVGFYVTLQVRATTPSPPVIDVYLRRAVITVAGVRKGSVVTFTGRATRWHSTALSGVSLTLQRYSGGRWVNVKAVRTRSDGRYTVGVTRSTAARYRLVYAGGPKVMGNVSPTLRR